MSPPKARRNTLLLAGAAVGALYLLPFGRLVLLPAIYLNTHLHELCHALAAIGTGGRPGQILVFGDGSGQCATLGGIAPVIASAGYLGAAILGATIVLVARTVAGARLVPRGLAITLAVSLVLLVRGDLIGVLSGAFWMLTLALMGQRLRGDLLMGTVQFLGLVQGLQSLTSIGDLLRISATAQANSDAETMAAMTRIPALAWALLWAVLSLSTTGWSLWRVSRSRPSSHPLAGP